MRWLQARWLQARALVFAMRDGAHVNDAFKLFVLADGHAGE